MIADKMRELSKQKSYLTLAKEIDNLVQNIEAQVSEGKKFYNTSSISAEAYQYLRDEGFKIIPMSRGHLKYLSIRW